MNNGFIYLLMLISVKLFSDLNLPENLKMSKESLKGAGGIYAIVCKATGTVYIGSTFNLPERIDDHVKGHSSNKRLWNAIKDHGLDKFIYLVLELFKPDPNCSTDANTGTLLAREQFYLDLLWSLPAKFRYNCSGRFS
jgi:group I intron endonuclease